MKKKNLKKLSLNKNAVSQLDNVKAGAGANPIPVGSELRVGSGCPICPVRVSQNATECNCASEGWFNLSCWIC